MMLWCVESDPNMLLRCRNKSSSTLFPQLLFVQIVMLCCLFLLKLKGCICELRGMWDWEHCAMFVTGMWNSFT